MTMPSTFTSLRYHIVFSTKNRQPFLMPPLREPMPRSLGGCIRSIAGAPLEIGGVADHVHILTALKPTHRLSDVLCDVKKGSSRWIREEMGCSSFHWQDRYAAFSVGRTELERVQRYIANRANHHGANAVEYELRELPQSSQI